MPILTGLVDFAYNVSEILLTEDSDDSLNTLVLMKNAGAAVCRVICVFAMPNVNANHQRVLFLFEKIRETDEQTREPPLLE